MINQAVVDRYLPKNTVLVIETFHLEMMHRSVCNKMNIVVSYYVLECTTSARAQRKPTMKVFTPTFRRVLTNVYNVFRGL